MKYKYFMKFLKKMILYTPDIDLYTAKTIISNFYTALNDSERTIIGLDLESILTTMNKQISLDSIVDNIKVENLKNQLETLKNGGKDDN